MPSFDARLKSKARPWQARIRTYGVSQHLGCFSTRSEAQRAEALARVQYHQELVREKIPIYHKRKVKMTANLGEATTEELLRELETRFQISDNRPLMLTIENVRLRCRPDELAYRTIDS